MSLIERARRAVRNPSLILREINRAYHTRFWTRPYNTEGVNVFDEDWDNLIILDACRYELLKERVNTGDYSQFTSKISRGANTYDFVKGNFFGQELSDTVYLTANGHIYWMEEELEADVELFDYIMFDMGEEDNEVGATLPETVRKQTEESIKEYDNKRFVIHFIQPHYPFLDKEERFPKKRGDFWYEVHSGQIEGTHEEFWEAYSETFDKAWEEVEKLIEELDGKTVVTSDHGNVFGERVSPIPMKEWGHPQGIYDEKLVKVPWLVIEGDERRGIVKGEPEDQEEYDEEEIKDQLADLGYGG